MNPHTEIKAVAYSERVFRRLLAAYPSTHREEYGEPMAQLFRDQCRDAWHDSRHWGLAKLWLRVLPDVVATSFSEHLEAIKQRKFMSNRRAFYPAQFIAIFTAVFLLVVITATVVTFILPELYVGKTRVNVRRDGTDVPGMNGQYNGAFGVDPFFIQTEFEIIQSQVMLEKVVEKLNLNEQWGKKYRAGERLLTVEAVALLKNSIDLRPIRNTSLIEIRGSSDRPEEAAQIANSLAEAYRNYSLERNREVRKRSIVALKEQLEETKQEMSTNYVRGELVRFEGLRNRLEKQLTVLRDLPREKLRYSIQNVIEPEDSLNALLKDHDLAKEKLIRPVQPLMNDLSELKKAESAVQVLEEETDRRVDAILAEMETRLADLTEKTKFMSDPQASGKNLHYMNGLMELESALKMKIRIEEAQLNSSQLSGVEILDRATPSMVPVRPNKPLNISLGIIGGVVLGLIAATGVAGISFISRRTNPKIAS